MLTRPRATKYRKMQRGTLTGIATSNNALLFPSSFGIQALEPFWLTPNQLEAARRIFTRRAKKIGKLYTRVFPDKAVTARSKESRMGSGKGAVDRWVAPVLPGTIIFEITNISKSIANSFLRIASSKLPIRTCILEN